MIANCIESCEKLSPKQIPQKLPPSNKKKVNDFWCILHFLMKSFQFWKARVMRFDSILNICAGFKISPDIAQLQLAVVLQQQLLLMTLSSYQILHSCSSTYTQKLPECSGVKCLSYKNLISDPEIMLDFKFPIFSKSLKRLLHLQGRDAITGTLS